MISKFTSSKQIIAKVLADYNLDENHIKITDIREWIGEAIQKIGAVNQFDHKVKILELKNYQATLPCDLEKIDYVAYSNCNNNGWIPMKKATGAFSVYDKKNIQNGCNMKFQDTALFPLVKNIFNLTEDKDALDKLNSDPNIRQTLSALLNQHTVCNNNGTTNLSNTIQYALKPGYIMSNVRDGYIKLSYYGIYTDDDGMPLIPDNESYKEAIMYYIGTKVLYSEWIKGKINSNIYYAIKSSWNFYRKQAYAEAMMPDQNDLINIKNTWHTLVPDMDSIDNFLSTTGDSQIIYNQNSIWK